MTRSSVVPVLVRPLTGLVPQLVGAALFCVLPPMLLHNGMQPSLLLYPANQWMVGGLLAAILGGYLLHRKLISYPGVAPLAFILPAFTTAFGLVIALFFFFRIDYSRAIFLECYVLSLVWVHAHALIERRIRTVSLAIVPGGDVERLSRIAGVDWRRLAEPGQAKGPWNGIVADLRADLPPEWVEFIATAALEGVPVYHVKQVRESLTGRVEIEHLSENTLGSLNPNHLYFRIRHAADWLLAAAVLVAGLLPGLLLALAIKLESRGPAFYVQSRLGYRGRVFRMVKFRTMHHRPEAGDEDQRLAAITRAGDSRITRIGRILRRSRIDELPQVLNILRGEMGWIGPRPEALPLAQEYRKEVGFYSYRHIVRPGITGWAQVNQGHVTSLEQVRDKLSYDFFYIARYSAWLDILIAIRTIGTVLSGRGAR